MSATAEAYIPDNLFEAGIGTVIVARRKGGGRVEAGVFLLDVYCLGVKDAWLFVGADSEFDQLLADTGQTLSRHPAARGRKLVEDAARYAAGLGFATHRDYKQAARVFGGIKASDCDEEFVFGKKGKPFFVNGPHISTDRAMKIVEHLKARCGEGNFDYLIGMDQETDDWEDDFDEDEEDAFPPIVFSDSASSGETLTPEMEAFVHETMNGLDPELHPAWELEGAGQQSLAEWMLGAASVFAKRSGGGEIPLSLDAAICLVILLIQQVHFPEEAAAFAASSGETGLPDLLADMPPEVRAKIEKTLPRLIIVGYRVLSDPAESGSPARILVAYAEPVSYHTDFPEEE
jgi:hypothetical protein